MKHYFQAIADLLGRYTQVFKAAWGIRHQLDGEARSRDELAFLPAQLELIETPVHPAPRWSMRLLMAFAGIAVLWSIFGRLDVVVVAQGKLIPNARVKVIQPMDTGIVRNILVQNGQRVHAGDTLVELDLTQAGADASKATASLLDAQVAAARAQTLLQSQQSKTAPVIPLIPGLPDARQRAEQAHAEGQYREYRDKLAALDAELTKRQAEFATAKHEIDKLTQTLPLAKQVADSYRELSKDNYVAKQEYLQKEQTRIEQEHDLATHTSHAKELEAAIEEQRRQMDATTSQFRREQLDDLAKAQQQLAQAQQDATKTTQREQRLRLTTPIDGVVQQLAIHTSGGVVTTAQMLMNIVPDDTLEVEANVENKDIGFVNPGQDATIKVEAFPYTRFGTLSGKVSKVSNDATQDKKLGLVYPLIVTLPTNRMQIENKWVNLTPGMAVSVEVKTGSRRVAEYFLSPLVVHVQESFRER